MANDDYEIYFHLQGEEYNGSTTLRWCDKPGAATPCWDVEHIALHEFGHVLNLNHHENGSDTVMDVNSPTSLNSGGTTHSFGGCDKAKLQLKYDVPSNTSSYSDCLTGLTIAGTHGLITDVTFNASATLVCVGENVTFSGSLHVSYEGYGMLDGNQLAIRDILVQRSTVGAGSYSLYVTDATGTSATWSRVMNFGTATDYDWRSKYNYENGLDDDASGGVRGPMGYRLLGALEQGGRQVSIR